MRDEKRIAKILGDIKEIWEKNPDWRFGQLLVNVGLIEDTYNTWSIEDDKIEEVLKKFKEFIKKVK